MDESQLDNLSKAITLKYDSNYYTNLEAEEKREEAERWKCFWDEINAPIEAFNQSIIDDIQGGIDSVVNTGEKIIKTLIPIGKNAIDITIDGLEVAFEGIIENPARLGELGFNWLQKQAGLITEEEFNNRLDSYCEFVEDHSGKLQSIGAGLANWGVQSVFGGTKIICVILEFLEKDFYAYEGINNDSFFERASEKTDEWSQIVHDYFESLAPDETIFEETQIVASVVAITKSLTHLLKGVPKVSPHNSDEASTIAERLKNARHNIDDIGSVVVNENGTITAANGMTLKGTLEGLGALVDEAKGVLEVIIASDIAIGSAALEAIAAAGIAATGSLTGGGGSPEGKIKKTYLERIDELKARMKKDNVSTDCTYEELCKKYKGKYTKKEIAAAYNGYTGKIDKLDKIDYQKILKEAGRPVKAGEHAHHIVYKVGQGGKVKEVADKAQDILKRYGIDPVTDPHNLVSAPNKGHSVDNIQEVYEGLKEAERLAVVKCEELGITDIKKVEFIKQQIYKELEELGKIAAGR